MASRRQHLPLRWLAAPCTAALCAGLAGCSSPTAAQGGSVEPVFIALLTSGASSHRASLTWSIPAESAAVVTAGENRAIDPRLVTLLLVSEDGTSGAFLPDSDTAGVFRAVLPVAPGVLYRLVGTIAGRSIGGETRPPGSITLFIPSDGLLHYSPNRDPRVGTIEYGVHSEGAARVGLVDPVFDVLAGVGDTVGVWTIQGVLLRNKGPNPMFVDAYDRRAAEFGFREHWTTDLRGALGVLGSRTRTSVIVIRD